MAVSSQLLTDLQSVMTQGPSAQTQTNANAPAGVILDFTGNLQVAMTGLAGAKRLLLEILKDVDPADPVLPTLQNVVNTIV